MAYRKDTTDLSGILLECMGSQDRKSYRSGYRPRRLDTRMGTMYLLVPKVRNGGYIPFFITERKRSEAALIQVIQETYIQGVSTRKIEKLAHKLGIENLSRSQVSEMTKGLNEQAEAIRNRELTGESYPVIWVDALYEKVRYSGRVVSMAIQIVYGVNARGQREVLAIEPMLEESSVTYGHLFSHLKERGLTGVELVVSDANSGLNKAIRASFPGASWQRCKVHFMRNFLAYVSQRDKAAFAASLKLIWQAGDKKAAREQVKILRDRYETKYPKALEVLDNGLEDSLSYYNFLSLDTRKTSSNNMIERLNKEIRRRTKVIGIFPTPDAYIRLVSIYLWSTRKTGLSQKLI